MVSIEFVTLIKQKKLIKNIHNMSLLSENVIPGNHGKTFETDAKSHDDLSLIKNAILNVDGIKDVIINEEEYPKQFTIHTTKIVDVKSIEQEINKTGFHAIPKSLFSL